jgi:hypothetical protein
VPSAAAAAAAAREALARAANPRNRLAVSTRNRARELRGFRVRELTVGVLSSTIYIFCSFSQNLPARIRKHNQEKEHQFFPPPAPRGLASAGANRKKRE